MDSPNTPPSRTKKSRPSPRRDGREAAVQYLFAYDLASEERKEPDSLEEFWSLRIARPVAREFATTIIHGVLACRTEIDAAIRERLENFAFHRLEAVDRNILRVGTWEILHADHIPPQAAVNEAIEIAKRFGTPESPRFVNGVLDQILRSRAEPPAG